ncbi:hypothetical protein N7U66_11635 [Lacinutrix neustonica]|uniref:Uncharacterized protein n=1 Tax=Lacinutrix neustonica TaxID=2980107 RepID=A0A9E8SD59_9FLAO|nr:hypothetical protein [Lacinutrix neustonica]WAC00889.1 hypothetical protein N7U66_11635 [Lacinutrix neustonica]
MFKKTISIFFVLLFLATITAPSIIIAMDNSVDISVFYSLSEEEEEKTKEKDKVETYLSEKISTSDSFIELLERKDIRYYFKKYQKPHLNLISPPPENHIL